MSGGDDSADAATHWGNEALHTDFMRFSSAGGRSVFSSERKTCKDKDGSINSFIM